MSIHRRKYPKEFKMEMVEAALSGQSPLVIGKENNLAPNLISRWKKQYLDGKFHGNSENDNLEIKKIITSSGKKYEINKLILGEYQYVDRYYQFNYIPGFLNGCTHIKTHGNDKLIKESDVCVSFEVNCPVEVFILYADKFPVLPKWLHEYKRTRFNITRQDSRPDNLKGYFSLYKKYFPKGHIVLYGCSPEKMVAESWYAESMGENYCMYSILVLKYHNQSV